MVNKQQAKRKFMKKTRRQFPQEPQSSTMIWTSAIRSEPIISSSRTHKTVQGKTVRLEKLKARFEYLKRKQQLVDSQIASKDEQT